MRACPVICVILYIVSQVSAFDDTTLQLAIDVADKAIVQTLFKKEGNQELLNYINKYKQLILQVIRIIKKINLKDWIKLKGILERLKIVKNITLPHFSFDKLRFLQKLKVFGFNQEKIKMYMPKLSKNIDTIKEKLSSVGLNEDKVNEVRTDVSDAMFLMSKVYNVFMYTNMLLKGAAFSRFFNKSEANPGSTT